jgi:hypothetical protein
LFGDEKNRRVGSKVLGLFIDALDWSETLCVIAKWALRNESRYMRIRNVHSVVTALQETEFGHVVNEADMATPDDAPLRACSMGIDTRGCSFSLEGEGWDEGEYNLLILFSSPQPSVSMLSCPEPCGRALRDQIHSQRIFVQQEWELGTVTTHCFYNAEKLCRYLWYAGQQRISVLRGRI